MGSESTPSWTLEAIAADTSIVAEFEAVPLAQWRAKVDGARAGTVERLQTTTEDGVPLAALYTRADARPHAPLRWPESARIGRLHDAVDPKAAALPERLQHDANRG
ncbi:MAG: hypothetical protein AAF721_37680, partial [Myxococcota bacterium]